MPTGYTADIAEGISFEQFAMNCARAFGACVTMREESSDKPIPKKFKPSDYHIKEISKAEKELEALKTMSKEEAKSKSLEEYLEAVKENERGIKKANKLLAKYKTMLAKVKDWNPPSSDHIKFKEFMIEQITGSIDFDCNTTYYSEKKPVLLTARQWIEKRKEKLLGDLDYHKKKNEEEIERVNGRNLWLEQLRSSLKIT